jgi:hypothetical protein
MPVERRLRSGAALDPAHVADEAHQIARLLDLDRLARGANGGLRAG